MPRGVPKAGFRMTKNRVAKTSVVSAVRADMPKFVPTLAVSNESDAQIEARLAERFGILSTLTNAALSGDARSLIVSGPPGLGKSYTVEEALRAWDPSEADHTIVKGYVKATGLLKLLYQYKDKGQVIVFDDADTVFYDDTSLNMLKAVCDTTEKRKVSYLAEANLIDEDSATRIPRTFEFEGTIIFITNLDFDALIDKGHKLAPHLQALVSRSHYIDLALKTRRDFMVRIRQVIKLGLLRKAGLTSSQEQDVLTFLDKNQESLRELSLRIALKVGAIRKMQGQQWEKIARVTCCR